MTTNRDIPFAKSLIDYISRWLGMTFLPGYREAFAPKRPDNKKSDSPAVEKTIASTAKVALPESKKAQLNQISNRIDDLIGMVNKPQPQPEPVAAGDRQKLMTSFNGQFSHFQEDAPVCDTCGSITVRNGNCYRCHNCGSSMGCS